MRFGDMASGDILGLNAEPDPHSSRALASSEIGKRGIVPQVAANSCATMEQVTPGLRSAPCQ